jgi:tetratricopeptide (TPR) repeat protein
MLENKRLKSLLLFLLTVLSAGIVACTPTGETRKQLKRSELLLESDPQAALTLLDSMGKVHKPKKDVALYAVLRTQAEYKSFVPFSSDSLIRMATDYYGTPRRKDYYAALAWYSLGCVCSERKDDLGAIDAYLRALELFPDTTVRYYSLAEQNLGIHYLNRQMLDDALTTFNSCRNHLVSEKDFAYVDYYTALAHLYNKEYTEAEQGFSDTWNNPLASRFLKGESLLQLAKIAFHHHADYPATLDYIDRHIAFTNARYLGVDYSLKGDVFYALATQETPSHQAPLFDSAYYYYRQSLRYENEVHTLCCNYRSLAELAPQIGEVDSIGNYVAHYTLLLDSIGDLRRTEEIAALQNTHTLELEHRQMSYRQRWLWLTTGFVVFAVLMLLFLWFIQRDRKRKSDYITLCDEIRQSKLTKYVTVQETLDDCCTLFRKTAAYDIMSETAQSQLLQIDKKAPNLIAHDIDTCFFPLKKMIHSEAPTVNEKEFSFIVCYYLGFDLRTISLSLSSAYSTLTAMKSRLKKKIPAELYAILFPASSAS